MDSKLLESIRADIKARSKWADRQAVWYQMRRDGLRRKAKPFPGAADMHFPLVDTIIEKFKPFYLNQLFATERLADFTSRNPQSSEAVTDAAWWFDYKLKHHSNLEREMPFVFDLTLQSGRGIVKITWDADKKQVRFDSVDPAYLIVPPDTDELQNADRVVHVEHFSPWRYANGAGWQNRKQDAEFVKKITGGNPDNETQSLEDAKRLKEGITHSTEKDCIIVWEVYERTKTGWDLHTVSPVCEDEDIRPKVTIPYRHNKLPFVDFAFEETDKSYYSPRGVAEILAPFEASLCKQWNEKHDAMSFYNRPLFYTSRDIPNAGNIRMRPGDILPFEIKAVDRGAPPISWDQEMINTRMVAEQRIATPDFGIGGQDPSKDNKTAREIDEISAQRNQVVDMRSRITRRQLGEMYSQAYALLDQYDSDFQFLKGEAISTLSKPALDEIMSIKPNGSSDSWNQHSRLKKAVARKQLLGQSPFIDQGELDKSLLELDEPGLVRRLFRDPGTKQQDQVTRIMMVIPALEDGLAVAPLPDDDDAIHASFLLEYIGRSGQTGKPLDQLASGAMRGRLQQHMLRLQEKDPKAAREIQQKAVAIMKAMLPQSDTLQPGQPQPPGGQPQ